MINRWLSTQVQKEGIGSMKQEYFDLSKQITHLAIDKSVMFELSEIDIAEKVLRNSNYRNWVSCSKIKFAELIGDSLVMYKTASFRDWKDYFEMDCRVSKYLMGNMIDFERTINSRVSYYITKMIEKNFLSEYEKNEIIQLIQSSQRRRLKLKGNQKLRNAYNGNKTWEFIVKMTFGEMKQILFWLYDNKLEVYLEIVGAYRFLKNKKYATERFDEINKLRNNLFHFRPLNVYITHGNQNKKKLNNKFRKDAVDFIFHLNRNQKIALELEEIFKNSDNYVKIKNSQCNVG